MEYSSNSKEKHGWPRTVKPNESIIVKSAHNKDISNNKIEFTTNWCMKKELLKELIFEKGKSSRRNMDKEIGKHVVKSKPTC